MRIITWNINSVRLRIGLVEHLLDSVKPDVLCLQETKVIDADFPRAAFTTRGYIHQHIHGMKSYNGVAIISRLPLTAPREHHWQDKEDRRHIAATLPNGTELHCCYVPAGGDIPDPVANPKFAHKLGFMDDQTRWWKKRKNHSSILVGDLNVAPLEHDVWSHKQMLDVVSHTPVEVEKFTAWQKAFGGTDALRHFVPDSEKLYSWWSYRAQDWVASNRGRRLDHIWVTADLAPRLKAAHIIREARGWEPKPSDHVPVVVDLK
ncbi:MAG: exodeoxyribonuclease III [Alphaproteobacteria bacterium]|nr:exodeoxyribonuclease III [Alphaproteobacteria bacterium]MBV8549367.1 exodeoxyribonuclease III [Alphaproteobacteria bacterium]